MPIVIPSAGEDALLKDALGVTIANNLNIRLFVNNYTPNAASITSSFTEMVGLGYASKTILCPSMSVNNVSGSAEGSFPVQTWVFSAGAVVTIYGYYVVGADGVIRYAEKFNIPFVAQFAGDSIVITPKITLTSIN